MHMIVRFKGKEVMVDTDEIDHDEFIEVTRAGIEAQLERKGLKLSKIKINPPQRKRH